MVLSPSTVYAFAADPATSPAGPVALSDTTVDRTSLRLSLLPATAADVAVNKFLWLAAQDTEFDAGVGRAVLRVDPMVLAFPAAIHELLQSLSFPALQATLMELLALVVEDEDPLVALDATLDLDTRAALDAHMDARNDLEAPPHGQRTGRLEPRELAHSVETLLRHAGHSAAWRVNVPCLRVVQRPPEVASAQRSPRLSIRQQGPRGGRRNGADRATLFGMHTAYHPLRKAVKCIGVPADTLAALVRHALAADSAIVPHAWSVHDLLVAASRRPRKAAAPEPGADTRVTHLPLDVVETQLGPRVLLAILGAPAPARDRRPDSLHSDGGVGSRSDPIPSRDN
jgi:hypothetical protein